MEELSPAKRALQEARLRTVRSSVSDTAIPRRNSTDSDIPLSSAQTLIWLQEQVLPGRGIYNVTRHIHIGGSLSEPALQAALNALVARHEILRTTYPLTNGTPTQRI